MTYCVAIKLNAGLVFLSDSRTHAGLDQINLSVGLPLKKISTPQEKLI